MLKKIISMTLIGALFTLSFADLIEHKVSKGETLSSILQEKAEYKNIHFLYNDVYRHKKINELENQDLIYAGDIILIDTESNDKILRCTVKVHMDKVEIIDDKPECLCEDTRRTVEVMALFGITDNKIQHSGIFEGDIRSNYSMRMEVKAQLDKYAYVVGELDFTSRKEGDMLGFRSRSKTNISLGLELGAKNGKNYFATSVMAKSYNLARDYGPYTIDMRTQVTPVIGVEFNRDINKRTNIGMKVFYGKPMDYLTDIYGARLRLKREFQKKMGGVLDIERVWARGEEKQEIDRIQTGLYFKF